MSAFLTSEKSIAKLASVVNHAVNYGRISSIYMQSRDIDVIKDACRNVAQKTGSIGVNEQNLYRALEDMNLEALRQRYGDDAIAPGSGWEARTCPRIPMPSECLSGKAREVQTLKSIQCYLYQCSEGDVDESPLYHAINRVERQLMNRIINAMPEYEAAAWD